MRLSFFFAACAIAVLWAAHAAAAQGNLSYKARVVHNSRQYLSYVTGTIDLASGDFTEQIDESFRLNWRVVPSSLEPASQSIPSIWREGRATCQRFEAGLPRMNSPLLRHFIVGRVLRDVSAIAEGQQYMSGQLEILTAEQDADSFELVASYMGSPLVIVGRLDDSGAVPLVQDLAVLGASEELYQYFIDEITYLPGRPAADISIPEFNPDDYVTFPAEGSGIVPIRPVKDWLVFQAQLPNGRPLNLVFDSGAETMIVDDMVLKVDAQLEPTGDMLVSGAFDDGKMQLYDGFEFEIGGVQFKNLPVAGTMLTTLGYGANLRIHGIVGNEILQLCRLDLDLSEGNLHLSDPKSPPAETGEEMALTFIHDLPHIKADVEETGDAWLLVDTGQQTPLQVNIDFLEDYQLGDDLVMYGFHSDITGGLRPRYMIEQLDVSLGGTTYRERTVDALMASSFDHDGVPVVGSIGFPLLARHFGGITFDYSRQLMYLRDPSENHVFAGRPEAWTDPADFSASLLADADIIGGTDAVQGKPGQSGKPAANKPRKDQAASEDQEDPRAKYPWFVQHQALSQDLGEIRSSAPVEPPAAGSRSTSKQPFTFNRDSALALTDRLLLYALAEAVSEGIAGAELMAPGKITAWTAPGFVEPDGDSGTEAEADAEAGEQDTDVEPPTDIFRRGQPKLNFSPLPESAPDYLEDDGEQESKSKREDDSGSSAESDAE